MEIFNIVVLSLSGILLIYAGSMRLIKPLKSLCLETYLNDPQSKLEGKVDIFNEMRAAGASLAFGGIIILLGIFIAQLMISSFVVAVVIFLGHAFGRIVSARIDGKANKQLAQGLMSELLLGSANAVSLIYLFIYS